MRPIYLHSDRYDRLFMHVDDRLIPSQEGYLFEFKEFSCGVSIKALARTLCAFANMDGGDLYLGVTDQRRIKGLTMTPILARPRNT